MYETLSYSDYECRFFLVSPLVLAKRVALVVGNAAYADQPLKNPVNDAKAVSSKLKGLGFEVMLVENLKKREVGRTLAGFAQKIGRDDEVVVFYAGHGLQVRGENYLPTVDAKIESEEDVETNSLKLNDLLSKLDESRARVKIVILDACRNNPYSKGFRSLERGLARVQDAPSGTLMHFATRPGQVAADGEGGNGLYTTELLKVLDKPGIAVEQLFKQVSQAVVQSSREQQEPWQEGSLRGEFYFASAVAPAIAVKPNTIQEPLKADAEQEAWELAKKTHTAEGYQGFLEEFPKGRFASAARSALKGLTPSSQVKTKQPLATPSVQNEQDREAWELAKRRDTREAYLGYIKEFPQGLFSSAAKSVIGVFESVSISASPSSKAPSELPSLFVTNDKPEASVAEGSHTEKVQMNGVRLSPEAGFINSERLSKETGLKAEELNKFIRQYSAHFDLDIIFQEAVYASKSRDMTTGLISFIKNSKFPEKPYSGYSR